MADGVYVGMAGAAARAAQLDSVSDNLSNANSPGFKSGTPAFQTFLASANDKGYSAAVGSGFDLRKGEIERTGNPMDILPEGTSFIGVMNGEEMAYTRNGRLNIDLQGRVLAGDYQLVTPDGDPISVPIGSEVRIQTDGIITASGRPVGQVALFQLEGPLNRVGASLLAPADGGAARPVVEPIRVGELERSNARSLETAVQLVSAQRHYENSIQALQTYRRMDERANEVGRVR